ncbi:hypothetical protein GALMADRAFT_230818 [Galerina marginata CBS 339.88]|uniref:G-protein coupled receptors family 1 profile domain-containing protein n=1 Tax=Galerina marginata (strain CBS 339.88) TaxID=685588 RepID=A0A067SRA1_GALM3|nr:hypothetical protein GALMADRAFT_230818 [Galerina marginata CBS 339.88]
MQGIMIYRVSSMYNHDRKIIFLLATAFSAEIMSLLALQIIANGLETLEVPDPAPGVHLCKQRNMPSWSYITWVPVACFETLILVLSLSLAIKHYRTLKLNHELPISSNSSLAFILFRDSITFPFITLAVCITNFIMWMHPPYLMGQMTFTMATFSACIIGSRLILNLREAYYSPFMEECNVQEDIHDAFELSDVLDITR